MRKTILAAIALTMMFGGVVFAQAPATPAYELRIYTCNPDKLPVLEKRFREHSVRLLAKHGMESLYYWTVSEGATGDQNAKDMLIYILAHKDRESAVKSWEAFRADPEWQEVQKKSEENGKLLASDAVSIFMTPTEFSPAMEPANKDSNAPARLFELRKYNVGETGLPGTVDRFAAGEAELFRKHGMQTLAFWTADDKSSFIYLLAHKDRETSRQSWQTFFAEFRNFQTEYNARRGAARAAVPAAAPAAPSAGAPATQPGGARRGGRGGGGGNEIRFLIPTDYSPRK